MGAMRPGLAMGWALCLSGLCPLPWDAPSGLMDGLDREMVHPGEQWLQK